MAKLWPILLVIGANVFYNICAKELPANLDPLFSLTVTYGVAMLVSAGLFFLSNSWQGVFAELVKLDWTSLLFGVCIIGLEFGYMHVYRAGWKISTASLVANIGLAVILLLVGVLLYREQLSLRQVVGMILCLAGLFCIGH